MPSSGGSEPLILSPIDNLWPHTRCPDCVHAPASLTRLQIEELTLKCAGSTQLRLLFNEPMLVQISHVRLKGDTPFDRESNSLTLMPGACTRARTDWARAWVPWDFPACLGGWAPEGAAPCAGELHCMSVPHAGYHLPALPQLPCSCWPHHGAACLAPPLQAASSCCWSEERRAVTRTRGVTRRCCRWTPWSGSGQTQHAWRRGCIATAPPASAATACWWVRAVLAEAALGGAASDSSPANAEPPLLPLAKLFACWPWTTKYPSTCPAHSPLPALLPPSIHYPGDGAGPVWRARRRGLPLGRHLFRRRSPLGAAGRQTRRARAARAPCACCGVRA
jgi:hypothetical protein